MREIIIASLIITLFGCGSESQDIFQDEITNYSTQNTRIAETIVAQEITINESAEKNLEFQLKESLSQNDKVNLELDDNITHAAIINSKNIHIKAKYVEINTETVLKFKIIGLSNNPEIKIANTSGINLVKIIHSNLYKLINNISDNEEVRLAKSFSLISPRIDDNIDFLFQELDYFSKEMIHEEIKIIDEKRQIDQDLKDYTHGKVK